MTLRWIGLWEVKALNTDVFEGNSGAFVHVLGLAETETEFRRAADVELARLGLVTLNVEDVELMIDRLEFSRADDDLKELLAGLTDDEPIAFGVFDAYPSARQHPA